MMPPTVGPALVPAATIRPKIPMARPRSLPGKARVIMAGLMAMSMAPPTPCRARNNTRDMSDGAMPQRMELRVNTVSPAAHRNLLPHQVGDAPQDQQQAADDDEVGNNHPFHQPV